MTNKLFALGFTILFSSLAINSTYANVNDNATNTHTNTNSSKNVSTAVSDSGVTTKVKTKFMADDAIKSLNIHVETVNGIVTLKGKVVNQDVKDKAIAIAKSTDGVKDVVATNLDINPNS